MSRLSIGIAGLVAMGWAAAAGAADPVTQAMTNFQTAGSAVNEKLVPLAIKTACAAVTLQWILTYWKEIFNADISNVLAKAVGMLSWFGATIWLLNHQTELSGLFAGYVKLAADVGGVSADDFTPWGVLKQAKDVMVATHSAVWKASDVSAWQIGESVLASITLVAADLLTMIAFFMIALSLFVATLEFWMLFAVAPLAFGLVPLSAFRDQGMAPIKGVISLGLRILILSIVVAVSKSLTETVLVGLAAGLAKGQTVFVALLEYLAGLFGCAIMAISSGKLASSIASGSASFSGGDAIRAGMTTAAVVGGGAALTALAKPALASAAGAAGKGLAGMAGDFAKGAGSAASKAGVNGLTGGGAGSGTAGMHGFGGPPTAKPPSLENRLAASTPSTSGASAADGKGESAGVEPTQTPEEKRQQAMFDAIKRQQPSALQKAVGSAADHAAEDQHAVGIQINTKGE